ncbi:hypothetical protein B0H14DRAFT_2560884 [Mycena olivaceomarginata]|nr:hypothetical protein B0H14DRAFT_2560884 [Mycena olivaceomarginata]
MQTAPPSYTTVGINASADTHEAPPAYSFPEAFTIGGRTTKPFVNVSQIKDHLALLHAFAELKISVEGITTTEILHLPPDRNGGGHALQPSHSENGIATILPPIDVIMVSAVYSRSEQILSEGRWYAEDGKRLDALKGLHQAGNGLGAALPSQQRIDNWVQMTAIPFDPFESMHWTVGKEILCPKCQAVVDTRNRASEFLAGTVHTPTNVLNLDHGKLVKESMLSSPRLQRRPSSVSNATYAAYLIEMSNYRLDRVKKGELFRRLEGFQGGKLSACFFGIARILSAYVDDKIFSVELTGAILRQGSFVTKMYDLQWTKPGFFDSAEDEVALQHSYGKQLFPQYSKDTIQFVGRFVDHDDKVEESHLASSFDNTCRAWKSRFGVEYTHCGCPLPGDTIGQRLSRLVGHSTTPSYLIPLDRDDLLAATHPSDHNTVVAFNRRVVSQAAQLHRRAKIEQRQKRDFKRAQAGKLNHRLNTQHHPAFLIPVPMYSTPVSAGVCGVLRQYRLWRGRIRARVAEPHAELEVGQGDVVGAVVAAVAVEVELVRDVEDGGAVAAAAAEAVEAAGAADVEAEAGAVGAADVGEVGAAGAADVEVEVEAGAAVDVVGAGAVNFHVAKQAETSEFFVFENLSAALYLQCAMYRSAWGPTSTATDVGRNKHGLCEDRAQRSAPVKTAGSQIEPETRDRAGSSQLEPVLCGSRNGRLLDLARRFCCNTSSLIELCLLRPRAVFSSRKYIQNWYKHVKNGYNEYSRASFPQRRTIPTGSSCETQGANGGAKDEPGIQLVRRKPTETERQEIYSPPGKEGLGEGLKQRRRRQDTNGGHKGKGAART